jgi:hypothetical protein
MSIISSDKEFNNLIATSPRRLSNRSGNSETGSFRYQLGGLKQMQKFLTRVVWE